MIIVVAQTPKHVIQKVVAPKDNRVLRFQVFPRESLGDSTKGWPCPTLADAYALIGKGDSPVPA